MYLNWSVWILSILGSCLGDRLMLPSGGYARVTKPLEKDLDAFTLSAWVNVNDFSDGITPILTYLDQNASSQVSFFMRPSGVGVLWGGPIIKEQEVDLISRINRRPRLYWSDLSSRIRKKRGADYSAGLGDIENIMERSGRADNRWAPLNFVDVGVMGVDDLMVSGTEDKENIFHSPRMPRAQTYSEWTNVPYELHMQESIQSNAPVVPNEPNIITKPSGGDDFVYFNWNVPQNQRRTPLGSNSWSPIWESTKTSTPPVQTTETSRPVNVPVKHIQELSSPGWPSNVQQQVLSNQWDPLGFNDRQKEAEVNLRTKLISTNVERPVWPNVRNNVPHAAIEQNKEFKNPFIYEQPTRSFSNVLPTVPVHPSPTTSTTTTTTPITTQSTTKPTTPRTSTTPKPTTRREIPFKKFKTPYSRRKNIPPIRTTTTKPQPPKEFTTKPPQTIERKRTPLWKLIKKPANGNIQTTAKPKPKPKPKQTTKINRPVKTSITNNERRHYRYSLSDTQQKPKTNSRPTLPTHFTRPRTQPERLRGSFTTKTNTFIERPNIINRHQTTTQTPTTTTTTTTQATTPKRVISRPQLPINIRNFKPHVPKVPKVQPENKLIGNSRWHNRNIVAKPTRPQRPTNSVPGEDEFSKTMKDPKLVQEGNTAVVYAIPIQNEDQFYKMYQKYQEDSEKPNIHKMYQKMRKGGISDLVEEEENENELQQEGNYNYNKVISPTNLFGSETNDGSPLVVNAKPLEGDGEVKIFETFDQPLVETNSKDQEYVYEYFTEDDILIPQEQQQFEYIYEDEDVLPNDQDEASPRPETAIRGPSAAYFIPNEDDTALADLYREPQINVIRQETTAFPSFYQEPSPLSHQQLPPTYEKKDKETQSLENDNKLVEIIYSANPQELLAQGLLPRPIHVVETQEEAEKWMKEQKKSIPQEILNQPTLENSGTQPSFGTITPVVSDVASNQDTNNFPPTRDDNTPIEEIIQPRVPDGFASKTPEEEETAQQLQIQEDDAPLSIKIKELPYKFNSNGWYHIGFTWNTDIKKLFIYVNGEILGEIHQALNDKPYLEKGGLFLIGKTLLPDLSDFDETSQFLGEMSDLNLWSVDYTPLEMDMSFQCKKDDSTSNILKWGEAHMNLYNSAVMKKSPEFCGLVT